MSKLRRRHLDDLQAKLENITDHIVDVRDAMTCEAEARAKAERPRSGVDDALAANFGRLETLLNGVKVALERMGGTTLPAFREDLQALRHEMGQYHHEMASLNGQLPKVMNFIEALHIQHTLDHPQPAPPPKRRGRGRPKNDASQKLMDVLSPSKDEVEQEVVEE